MSTSVQSNPALLYKGCLLTLTTPLRTFSYLVLYHSNFWLPFIVWEAVAKALCVCAPELEPFLFDLETSVRAVELANVKFSAVFYRLSLFN